MSELSQVVLNGLAAGAVVALLAVSYSVVYGALRFINFTFGEILMVAAYGLYLLKDQAGWPWAAAVGVAVLAVAILGVMVQMAAYRPLYRRSRLACLVTAVGVSLLVQNAMLMWFDARPRTLREHLPSWTVSLGGPVLTGTHIVILASAAVLLIAAELFVFRSAVGLQIRAISDDMTTAELLGVRVDRAVLCVFALGAFFAAISGVLLSLEYLTRPTMGSAPGVQAFAACVVGGIGSVRGAVVMGFAVSLLGHLVTYHWPLVTLEISSYAILLLALAAFPRGLLPSARREREGISEA